MPNPTPYLALTEPTNGSYSGTWDQPVNNNTTILDYAYGATTSVSVSTSGTTQFTLVTAPATTPTANTSQCMRIALSGALSANQNVALPYQVAGMWVISNGTSGAYTVTIGSSNIAAPTVPSAFAGTSVTVSQSTNTLIFSDGTNVGVVASGVTSFNAGTTGLTPSSTSVGAITLAGTLGYANGGTGVTSPGTSGNVLTSQTTVFTGSTAGTTLSVTGITSGTLYVGQTITGSGLAANTVITAYGSGTGGTGNYTISVSQNVSSATMTATGWSSQSPAVSGFSGQYSNLAITASSSSVAVTARYVTVATSGGTIQTLSNVNISSIAINTTGANALDSGSLAANTFYSVYVIYNPTTATTAGLLSTSGTSPTLPSGYTYYARFGWVYATSTSALTPTVQSGNRVSYLSVLTLANSNASTPTAIDLTSGSTKFIPTTAGTVFGSVYCGFTTNQNVIVYINSNSNSQVAYANNGNQATAANQCYYEIVLQSNSIYYTNTGGTANFVYLQGWVDNI